jgi:DNA-binding NarL/FixJ family response regulator
MGHEERHARILIVEDSGFVRRSLQRELADEGYVVVGTCDALSALGAMVARLDRTAMQPDLVITDLALPGSDPDGREVMRALTALREERWPKLRILVHSRTTRPAVLAAAFAAGADGFISKLDEVEIVEKVRVALRGGPSVSPTVASYLRRGVEDLTQEQCEILELLAEGYDNEQIQRKVGIKPTPLDRRLEALREMAGILTGTRREKRRSLDRFAAGIDSGRGT